MMAVQINESTRNSSIQQWPWKLIPFSWVDNLWVDSHFLPCCCWRLPVICVLSLLAIPCLWLQLDVPQPIRGPGAAAWAGGTRGSKETRGLALHVRFYKWIWSNACFSWFFFPITPALFPLQYVPSFERRLLFQLNLWFITKSWFC